MLATGSTSGADDNSSGCGGGSDSGSGTGGPDVLFGWEATAPGEYQVTMLGTQFDTTLTVFRGNCQGDLSELECDDDGGEEWDSAVSFSASAGQDYTLVLDGYSSDEHGNWVINIDEAR